MRILIADSPEGDLFADKTRLRQGEIFTLDGVRTLTYAPVCGELCYFPRSYRFPEGDPMRAENPEVAVTRCGEDCYQLTLCPAPFARYEYPEPEQTLRCRMGSTEHTATLLRGNGRLLVVESESYYYRYPLPDGAEAAELACEDGLIRLQYAVQGENMQLLLDFAEDYAELFRGRADAVSVSRSEVSVTRTFCDNLGHVRMDVYRREPGRLTFVKSRFRHTKQARRSTLDTLLPYLFLEAVLAGDYAECRSYLHAECPLEPEDIAGFFGLPEQVRQNPFDGLPALLFAESRTRLRLQSYRFELADGLIRDIAEV